MLLSSLFRHPGNLQAGVHGFKTKEKAKTWIPDKKFQE